MRCRHQRERVYGLPDERLEDGGGGTFLELQFFVVQRFGICSALGSPLTQQDNAIVISQRQGALEESRTPQYRKQMADRAQARVGCAVLPLLPPAPFLTLPSHTVKPPGENIYYLLAASVSLLLISSSTTAISLLTMRLLNSPQ